MYATSGNQPPHRILSTFAIKVTLSMIVIRARAQGTARDLERFSQVVLFDICLARRHQAGEIHATIVAGRSRRGSVPGIGLGKGARQ
jgi:hypothetical protein